VIRLVRRRYSVPTRYNCSVKRNRAEKRLNFTCPWADPLEVQRKKR
jgi:hypothetical protein